MSGHGENNLFKGISAAKETQNDSKRHPIRLPKMRTSFWVNGWAPKTSKNDLKRHPTRLPKMRRSFWGNGRAPKTPKNHIRSGVLEVMFRRWVRKTVPKTSVFAFSLTRKTANLACVGDLFSPNSFDLPRFDCFSPGSLWGSAGRIVRKCGSQAKLNKSSQARK